MVSLALFFGSNTRGSTPIPLDKDQISESHKQNYIPRHQTPPCRHL